MFSSFDYAAHQVAFNLGLAYTMLDESFLERLQALECDLAVYYHDNVYQPAPCASDSTDKARKCLDNAKRIEKELNRRADLAL